MTILWVIASTVIHNIQQPIYISNKTFTVWLLYVYQSSALGMVVYSELSDCIDNCIIVARFLALVTTMVTKVDHGN